MIHWEDDTFFSSNISLFNQALTFMDNNHYRILFAFPAAEVDIDRFHNALDRFR